MKRQHKNCLNVNVCMVKGREIVCTAFSFKRNEIHLTSISLVDYVQLERRGEERKNYCLYLLLFPNETQQITLQININNNEHKRNLSIALYYCFMSVRFVCVFEEGCE